MTDATRRFLVGAIMVGASIGTAGATRAGLITYSCTGVETVGRNVDGEAAPTGIDDVSITLTVDASTITNDPALSTLSPGYTTGTGLATVSVSDPSHGELTATLTAHAAVSQIYSPDAGSVYLTRIEIIADSGPLAGAVIGRFLLEEVAGDPPQPVSDPLPITYDLKAPYGPVPVASPLNLIASEGSGIFYQFPAADDSVELGVTRPDDPILFEVLVFQASAVPEPSSLALGCIAGAVGATVAGVGRKRRA